MASVLLPTKGQVINKKKFYDEFGEEKDEDANEKTASNNKDDNKIRRKPEDYEAIFSGNTDDSFRMGIAVAKRTLKVCLSYIVQYCIISNILSHFLDLFLQFQAF